jgi:hypothetical protein
MTTARRWCAAYFATGAFGGLAYSLGWRPTQAQCWPSFFAAPSVVATPPSQATRHSRCPRRKKSKAEVAVEQAESLDNDFFWQAFKASMVNAGHQIPPTLKAWYVRSETKWVMSAIPAANLLSLLPRLLQGDFSFQAQRGLSRQS